MTKSHSIGITKAKIEDEDFLFDLRKQTMVVHLERSGIFLSDKEHRLRVAKNYTDAFIIWYSQERVGLLKYIENEKAIEVLQIQVLPDYQGNGIGKQVLEQLIEQQKVIRLKILKENPAKNLYQRMGFLTVNEDDYEYHMELVPKNKNV